jgi:Arc/MetJ-type ribon-helix-helix transcriptional regulator
MSAADLTSMTVSLPASQKAYVRAQAAATGCSTPSEYIRRLIHADQRARQQEELERKLIDGLESGSREVTPEVWAEMRESLRKAASARKR